MARPVKCRKVEFFPESTYFIPVDKKRCDIEEISLKIEELEAMRLKDIEGLSQEECAKNMKVSRQTFQNIIDSARLKVAIALTEGKAINIGGGNYVPKSCKFRCTSCNEEYDINYNQDKNECPSCGSEKVGCSKKQGVCHKWCNK